MLYNTDGCHGKFLKYQIQVKNEIVLIPPISGSLCGPGMAWWAATWATVILGQSAGNRPESFEVT